MENSYEIDDLQQNHLNTSTFWPYPIIGGSHLHNSNEQRKNRIARDPKTRFTDRLYLSYAPEVTGFMGAGVSGPGWGV